MLKRSARRGLAIALLLLVASTPALAQVDIRTLEPGETGGPGQIASLEWLTGRWVGEGIGARAEAVYSAPAGGQIMGMFSLVGEEGPKFYEFILIEEVEGTLRLRLKHFSPDFSPWEAADETTDFDLVALEGTTAYFDGLSIHRIDEDELEEAVLVDHGGKVQTLRFRYRRQP